MTSRTAFFPQPGFFPATGIIGVIGALQGARHFSRLGSQAGRKKEREGNFCFYVRRKSLPVMKTFVNFCRRFNRRLLFASFLTMQNRPSGKHDGDTCAMIADGIHITLHHFFPAEQSPPQSISRSTFILRKNCLLFCFRQPGFPNFLFKSLMFFRSDLTRSFLDFHGFFIGWFLCFSAALIKCVDDFKLSSPEMCFSLSSENENFFFVIFCSIAFF